MEWFTDVWLALTCSSAPKSEGGVTCKAGKLSLSLMTCAAWAGPDSNKPISFSKASSVSSSLCLFFFSKLARPTLPARVRIATASTYVILMCPCPGCPLQIKLAGRSYQSHELPNVKQRKGFPSTETDGGTDEAKFGALGTSGGGPRLRLLMGSLSAVCNLHYAPLLAAQKRSWSPIITFVALGLTCF